MGVGMGVGGRVSGFSGFSGWWFIVFIFSDEGMFGVFWVCGAGVSCE